MVELSNADGRNEIHTAEPRAKLCASEDVGKSVSVAERSETGVVRTKWPGSRV